MQIFVCNVNVWIVIYLAPSGFQMENENKNQKFLRFIEVIFEHLFGQSTNNKTQKFYNYGKNFEKPRGCYHFK